MARLEQRHPCIDLASVTRRPLRRRPVVAVFDNLLPDSDDIRRRIAERAHAAGADAYHLLAAIGRDCVGALQFLPEGMEPATAGTIDARPVTDEEIAAIVGNLARNPLGIGVVVQFEFGG